MSRYRGRSALSALGIAVSVASMIALAGLVRSVHASMASGLVAIGSHVIMVAPTPQQVLTLPRRGRPLTSADVDAITRRVREAEMVAPVYGIQGMVEFGRAKRVVTIFGIIPGMNGLQGFAPEAGRFIVDAEVWDGARVAVVSSEVGRQLGELDPGDFIQVSGRPFRVVGVVGAANPLLGANRNDSVFIPASTADAMYRSAAATASIVVQVSASANLDTTVDQVRQALRVSRRLSDADPDDFEIQTQADLLRPLGQAASALQSFLVSLLGISLVIAAIGVLNSVLTSVLERTHEIGLRRAVGATRRAIQAQFVREACGISGAGALCGAVSGIGGGAALAWSLELPIAIDWRTVGVALSAALVFSVLAALWPAIRAGRLDPITALHHE